jgi:hypothetical protein
MVFYRRFVVPEGDFNQNESGCEQVDNAANKLGQDLFELVPESLPYRRELGSHKEIETNNGEQCHHYSVGDFRIFYIASPDYDNNRHLKLVFLGYGMHNGKGNKKYTITRWHAKGTHNAYLK